ncbi:MAG: exodeoxyribonuclease VII large subunit [Bacteroidales bacterium]|nr:exodeoxyribonuclease VII large subunit [Bacteroidales bacterium]
MSATEENRRILGLRELLGKVKEHIEEGFPEPVWVRAEISEVKNHPSGHCYLTLTESDGGLTAKVSAVIWASSYRMLRPFFVSETGEELQVGMNLLVRAQVQFSELYSFSLVITDIDPSFTIGELERQRRRTIARLTEEGMMDMNSTLSLPMVPLRFAVISADTAAGYRDFMHHLHDNEYGFRFHTELFPAAMQGSEAPARIMEAMDAVAGRLDEFDALLILRGGGGAMDLVCFDDYDLAVNVAQFPLPVLTGIGHDHDYHVIDMVAYANVKTPTALADYLVDLIAEEDLQVENLASRLHLAVRGKASSEEARFDNFMLRIDAACRRRFADELAALDRLELRAQAADPAKTLEKGYSIVLKNGRRVDSAASFVPGESLTLMMRDALVEVTVNEIKNNK